jgi:hypothetical protein
MNYINKAIMKRRPTCYAVLYLVILIVIDQSTVNDTFTRLFNFYNFYSIIVPVPAAARSKA